VPEREHPRALAIDATLWDEPTTGIGLYTHELTAALEATGVHPLKLGARYSGDSPGGAEKRTTWTLATLPRVLREKQVALYHAHGNCNLPLTKVPGTRFVLTVHDLIPLLLPETTSFRYRTQFRIWLTRSLQVADHVLCVSELSRRDLLRAFPIPEARTSVVYNGVDHVLRQPPLTTAEQDAIRSFALPSEFILFAGSWDVRKNLALVLDAWERLPLANRVPLVLVGQPWFGSGPVERRVTELRAAGRDLRALGFQSSAVLYELMRRATVFVFPSLYEGFGLPPLEAMRLGTPTIVSTAGSLPEVCGDAALAVDPHDAAGLAAALTRLLTSKSEREGRRLAGEQWASAFTWQRTARQTAAIYEHVLSA
jgi:glycosyltransferase involved in cell wall biosynthesis